MTESITIFVVHFLHKTNNRELSYEIRCSSFVREPHRYYDEDPVMVGRVKNFINIEIAVFLNHLDCIVSNLIKHDKTLSNINKVSICVLARCIKNKNIKEAARLSFVLIQQF